MARRVVISSLLTFAVAATIVAAADTTAGRTAYRNAQIVSLDPTSHRLVADFGNGQATLDIDRDISLASLHTGDPILIGVHEGDGVRPRIVYLRRSATAAEPSAAALNDPSLVPTSTSSVRRPMMVVPNPQRRTRAHAVLGSDGVSPADDSAGTVTFAGKTAAVYRTEPAPEPASLPSPVEVLAPPAARVPEAPVASAVESRRSEGAMELDRGLDSLGVLIQQADASWNAYLHGCPGSGPSDTRGWLTSASTAPATATGGCETLRLRVAADGARVRDAIRTVADRARAAWVPPGTIRDALRRRGLESTDVR
jgi:hypothetical protein